MPFAEWEEELVRYGRKHPHMRIIDSMDAIRPIMSRLSMLAPFDDHGIHLKVATSTHSAEWLLTVPHLTVYVWLRSPIQPVRPMIGNVSHAEASRGR